MYLTSLNSIPREAQPSRSVRATRYVDWNIVNCCTTLRKITLEKAFGKWMTLKVTEGPCNCCYSIRRILLPISGL